MKIEICEHLLSAWLKHIKKCQIVQTNWTISPLEVEIFYEDKHKHAVDFLTEIKNCETLNQLNIFKQSTLSQLILQCEIDIVGVKIEYGIAEKVYMIDSAFHEAGLNYGDVVARVLKKILRALFVADISFPDVPCCFYFASPKCSYELEKQIQQYMDTVSDIISKYYPKAEIKLLFNENFTTEVYMPMIKNIEKISDDNDLFLRSLQLAKISNSYITRIKYRESTTPIIEESNKPNDIPIQYQHYTYTTEYSQKQPKGIYTAEHTIKTPKGENLNTVFSILNGLIHNGKMTESLVEKLKDSKYCNYSFYLPTFPMLVPCLSFKSSGFELCRFYKNNPITINGIDYLVCSQWIPERIEKLKAWYKKINT